MSVVPNQSGAGVSSASSSARAVTVAIVGATGAVGQEFLRVLAQRQFPIKSLKLLASQRSAGKQVEFNGQTHTIEALGEGSFEGVDVALFSAGGGISRTWAPRAVEAGAVVVDNSSAFRMAEGVPLVVPEVNGEAVASAGIGVGRKAGIIANPNCSTIIMLVPVTPLHRAAGVRRMIVSTYQAASGAGAAAMAELEQQTRQVLAGEPVTKEIFAQQYAFNLFSHDSPIDETGYNEEEAKMVRETRKIWADAEARVSATCVRVPVMRAHAESITLEFDRQMDETEARQLLAEAPGVELMDDRAGNGFPTPLEASDRDAIYVGRIRRDISDPSGRSLSLFVCGDQIRKGAALNAVQIAEMVI